VLSCSATGHPRPRIIWKKENGQAFIVKDGHTKRKVFLFRGEKLSLWKVRRRDMGAFMCIASNDVPPTVSRRVSLSVNFPPSVKVNKGLVGCPIGGEVSLQCYVEASPKAISYWLRKASTFEKEELLLDGKNIVISEERQSYKVILTLTIKRFSQEDVGTYTCISNNSLGGDKATIRVYALERQAEYMTVHPADNYEQYQPKTTAMTDISKVDLHTIFEQEKFSNSRTGNGESAGKTGGNGKQSSNPRNQMNSTNNFSWPTSSSSAASSTLVGFFAQLLLSQVPSTLLILASFHHF